MEVEDSEDTFNTPILLMPSNVVNKDIFVLFSFGSGSSKTQKKNPDGLPQKNLEPEKASPGKQNMWNIIWHVAGPTSTSFPTNICRWTWSADEVVT